MDTKKMRGREDEKESNIHNGAVTEDIEGVTTLRLTKLMKTKKRR